MLDRLFERGQCFEQSNKATRPPCVLTVKQESLARWDPSPKKTHVLLRSTHFWAVTGLALWLRNHRRKVTRHLNSQPLPHLLHKYLHPLRMNRSLMSSMHPMAQDDVRQREKALCKAGKGDRGGSSGTSSGLHWSSRKGRGAKLSQFLSSFQFWSTEGAGTPTMTLKPLSGTGGH